MAIRSYRVRTPALRISVAPDWVSETLASLPAGQAVARLDEQVWNERFWWVFADVPGVGAFEGYVDLDCLEQIGVPQQRTDARPVNGPSVSMRFPGRSIGKTEKDPVLINELQARLATLLDDTSFSADVFDEHMAAAVAEFQCTAPTEDDRPLDVDGVIGERTWAALFSAKITPMKNALGSMTVQKRQNGTIRPIAVEDLPRAFGEFAWRPAERSGEILVSEDWKRRYLVRVALPLLRPTPDREGKITLHRRMVGPLRRTIARIRKAGLADRILTNWSPFCARHKGWDPKRELSSHSWGIAIDINDRWNGLGVAPPEAGVMGSVRELAPFFAQEGFAWGGDFSSNVDGMHFELARTDLKV